MKLIYIKDNHVLTADEISRMPLTADLTGITPCVKRTDDITFGRVPKEYLVVLVNAEIRAKASQDAALYTSTLGTGELGQFATYFGFLILRCLRDASDMSRSIFCDIHEVLGTLSVAEVLHYGGGITAISEHARKQSVL